MKYFFLSLILFLSSALSAQSEESIQLPKHEISTDLSGAFMDNFRIDYSRKGKKKGALVIGLRTRSEYGSVTIDTNRMTRFEDSSLGVPKAQRAVDLSVGVKSFLGNRQPQRGAWIQLTALTSLVQWQSKDYIEARAGAVFPDEYRKPLQMFGLEGNAGYRYLFNNGISINAFISMSMLAIRSEFISERFPEWQRVNGGFDIYLTGSFLTVGYAW